MERRHAGITVFTPPGFSGHSGRSGAGRGGEPPDGPPCRRAGQWSGAVGEQKPVEHHRAADAIRRRDDLQQLLRVRHRQGRPGAQRWQVQDAPVDGDDRRRGRQSGGQFAIDDLIKPYQLEERIYRLRCVEAWSMVIPWIGFPLGDLLKKVRADCRRRSTSRSRRSSIRSRCPASAAGARLAVRRRPAPRRSDASADDPGGRALRRECCRTRTARRSGWSCRGSTGSRASSRSCGSASSRSSRRRRGSVERPRATASTRTSIPTVDHPRWSQAQRAAHRRVLQAQDARCSTATATRSRRCTAGWT